MRYFIDSVFAVLLVVLVLGGIGKGQERLCATVISPFDQVDEPALPTVKLVRKVLQQVCDGKTCRMVEVEVPDYPRVPAPPPQAPPIATYGQASATGYESPLVVQQPTYSAPQFFSRPIVRGPFRGFFARLFRVRNR